MANQVNVVTVVAEPEAIPTTVEFWGWVTRAVSTHSVSSPMLGLVAQTLEQAMQWSRETPGLEARLVKIVVPLDIFDA